MLPIPFHKQETDFSCGPAVLKMVFAFFKKELSEQYLITALKTSVVHGTRNMAMADTVVRHGFFPYTYENGTMGNIRYYVEAVGIPVVVEFVDPMEKEGHYAVVLGFDRECIVLNDPAHGAGHRLPVDEFESYWHSGFEEASRWMMAISDKELPAEKVFVQG
jgi:ABC-type bacteriocin/lantibiotic exporters, contain an N-terminal double-glycine peptidase domain